MARAPNLASQFRQESSAPLVAYLERWLREHRAKLSRGNDLAKAMDCMLKRAGSHRPFQAAGLTVSRASQPPGSSPFLA